MRVLGGLCVYVVCMHVCCVVVHVVCVCCVCIYRVLCVWCTCAVCVRVVRVCTTVPTGFGGQKTMCTCRFSPSIIWVLGIKLRSSDLEASTLIC